MGPEGPIGESCFVCGNTIFPIWVPCLIDRASLTEPGGINCHMEVSCPYDSLDAAARPAQASPADPLGESRTTD